MTITVTEYRKRARQRIESGEMTDDEWGEITLAVLQASESYGLDAFDPHVTIPDKRSNQSEP